MMQIFWFSHTVHDYCSRHGVELEKGIVRS